MALDVQMGRKSLDQIKQHENYDQFLSEVKEFGHKEDVRTITKLLRTLKEIGLTEDEHVIQSLQADLLWNIEQIDMAGLFIVLEYELGNSGTVTQNTTIQRIIEKIGQKWVEIRSCKDFTNMYNVAHLFKPEIMALIDDKVADAAEEFKMNELTRIYCALAAINRRSIPALQALSYYMFKRDKMTPNQVMSTVASMNKINYLDQALLQKMSKDIIAQIDNIKSANVVGSLLNSAGQMRWRDPELISYLATWMMKNQEKCQTKHFKYLLLTMAYVSYAPYEVDGLFETMISRLKASDFDNPVSWIEVVWSLVVLGKVSQSHIESVLDPEFVNKISADNPSSVGVYFKILNINAAAKLFDNNYTGPILKSISMDNLIITTNLKFQSTKVYINKVLENIFPTPMYLKKDILIPYGFLVDAEFILDERNNPIEVERYTSNFGERKNIILPKGAHRIAMLILNLKDYTIGSREVSGNKKLTIEILNKVGYKVLLIPHNEIDKNVKIVQCVQYFQKKINELIVN